MTWLASNWFWIVVGALFVACHLVGHGGHRHSERPREESRSRDRAGAKGHH